MSLEIYTLTPRICALCGAPFLSDGFVYCLMCEGALYVESEATEASNYPEQLHDE